MASRFRDPESGDVVFRVQTIDLLKLEKVLESFEELSKGGMVLMPTVHKSWAENWLEFIHPEAIAGNYDL